MRRRTRCQLSILLVGLAGVTGCDAEPSGPARNVVLVSIDTLGAAHVGSYGYERDTTPNLDRLAADGTLFESAYTQQVWTLTSHLSMMTGLYPQAHGASMSRPMSPGATSLASILKQHGFRTGAFTGSAAYVAPHYGLGRGFDVYRTGKMDARADNLGRLQWLEEQARLRNANPDHRFFLFAHYFDPHSDFGTEVPYWVPGPSQRRYLPTGLDWDRRGDTSLLVSLEEQGDVNERDREVLTAIYDAGVRFCDQKGLGPLLSKLKSLGFDDETLVIVTSDHGEEFFEHGAGLHQQPYRETSLVPLVMRGPGIPRDQRIAQLVELVDLQPTILSLLGIDAPANVQGRDLSPLLRGDSLEPRPAYVDGIFGGAPPYLARKQSNVTAEIDGERWSYLNTVYDETRDAGRVFETRTPGELYKLDEDPGQQRNLLSHYPAIGAELEVQLLSWYAESEVLAKQLGAAPTLSKPLREQQKAQLRALGYAE